MLFHSPEAVALHNVTMKVSGGQQLVICGRTGRYGWQLKNNGEEEWLTQTQT